MESSGHFDIIIAGAGAAGLSLLWNLIQREELREKRILLADRVLEPVRDKTWCFWDAPRVPFQDMVFHTWKMLEVRVGGCVFSEKLQNYRYHCVKSDVYAENILKMAREAPNVTLIEADIQDFSFVNGKAEMMSSKGLFTSDFIFQSTLRPPGFENLKLDISLLQHFTGWHIRSEKPVFDPDKATFMDFDVPQKNGVTFAYVLPFTRHEALVEYTLFSGELLSDEAYKEGLVDYLSTRLKLFHGDYEVLYTEKGVIPMEDRRYPAQYCPRVWNMGTMGGLTKPSTGYTFTRIHRQAAEITEALAKGNDPPAGPASPYRFRVYDIMLLYNLQRYPDVSLRIFHDLFKKNRFERILQFLEEKTRIDQDVRIMASVPWIPFLRALYKMKRRILSGA